MKTTPASILLALAAAAPAVCQEEAAPPIARSTIQSIQFPGGTLGQFAEALRRGSAAPVNIVLPATAEKVTLPAMQLTSVSIGDALQAVATILIPEVRMDVQHLQREMDASPVFAVALMPTQNSPPPPHTIRVLSLAALTTPWFSEHDVTMITPETILTAVETGIAIGGGPKVDIRFHTDSRLLFVRGLPEQVQLVEDILLRLERDRLELQSRRPRANAGAATREAPADPAPPLPEPTAPTRRR